MRSSGSLARPAESSALKMLVRWGGIAVTTGYDYSHMSLRLSRNIPLSNFSIPSPVTDGVNVDVTGSASGSVDMTTKSIPLEVTTSLRLLTLLTAYGGVGFDFQLGGGSAWMSPWTQVCSAMRQGKTWIWARRTSLIPSHVDPSAAKIRGILGLQVNLFILRIFHPAQHRQHYSNHGQPGGGPALGVLKGLGREAAVNETILYVLTRGFPS
jgi:hypothetical protein